MRNDRYKLIQNLMPGEDNPGHETTLKRFFDDLPGAIDAAPDEIRAAYLLMQAPPEFELYDLQQDPYEFRNLAADPLHAAALTELKQQLTAWRTRTRDPLLDQDNLRRLKAEIDASFVNGEPDKSRLSLSYPEYFFASPQ